MSIDPQLLARAQALIGRNVGGYVVERILGFGGMSVVYLARKNDTSRKLAALKVLFLPSDMTRSQRKRDSDRFRDEAAVLLRLKHPNIPTIYGFGTEREYLYLVMQYIEGETLAKRLERGQLSYPDIIHYLQQIAIALDYAHQKGVVHSDIKPSNILLDRNGNVFLSDFGIARYYDRTTDSESGYDEILGTLGYMSPEQMQGKEVSPASDIYSLGVVLYKMVTGFLPSEPGPPLESLVMQFAVPPLAPRQVRPDLPPGSELAIMRALAVNPEQRQATATELFLDFLEGFRNSGLIDISTIPIPPTIVVAPVVLSPVGPPGDNNASTEPAPETPRQQSTNPKRFRGPGCIFFGAVFLIGVAIPATAVIAPKVIPIIINIFNIFPIASSSSTATPSPTGAGSTATPKGNPAPGKTPTAAATLPPGVTPTATATLPPGVTPTATSTLFPGETPTATPTISPLTPTPSPPILTLNPTSATALLCTPIVGANAPFHVENTGGGTLNWTASWPGTGYNVSPSSGSIGQGGSELVTVSKILNNGNVTISAPGATNSPQVFSITCTL